MTELKTIFVDVGQGDCTLLQLPDGRYMLIDVCRVAGKGIDIFKLLDDVLPDGADGRKKLDILAITHAHDDHITGIGDLYEKYEVEWLWVPQHEDRKKLAEHFGEYQDVVDKHPQDKVLHPKGSRTPINETDEMYSLGDGLTVRCFSPPGYIKIEESLTEGEAKQLVHENCLVLRIEFEGSSVLITGDSNVACWKRIEGYYPDEVEENVLQSDVLQASHHGSRTFVKDGGEDSEAWTDALDAIAPEYVVVSVGEDNRHSHPHEDMMDIYREAVKEEDKVMETSQIGTVVAVFDANGAEVEANDGSYAEQYSWDEDDDPDEDDSKNDGGGGKASSLSKSRRRSPTRLDNSPAA